MHAEELARDPLGIAAEMIAAGFRPVGKDFPVFLHPKTHEEYALARTERKSGRGYKGFTVYSAADVTLEIDISDLRRPLVVKNLSKGTTIPVKATA